VRQAQHTYAARVGDTRYPQVDAALGASRRSVTGAANGQPGSENTFNLYGASVSLHYDADLFGGNSRALDALAARTAHQQWQLEQARLMLVSSVAATAITQAKWTARIETSERVLEALAAQLALTRRRRELGAASDRDLLALQEQVAQAEAAIPALRQARDQASHLLAELAGKVPSEARMPAFTLDEFTLPPELPLQVPSELVRRRPDIRAAEGLLQAAVAEHGVAVARLYPQLVIGADIGSQSLDADKLFSPGTLVWGLAGQLVQPLFSRGRRSQARAAEAAFDAAAAHYRQTVLRAFREVADVLRALENNTDVLTAQSAAHTAALDALALVQRQQALGAASDMEVLVARQRADVASIATINARTQRLADTVAFFTAMGGGEQGNLTEKSTN
jgi:NodT family efflux transporter outer membrane factor (OMF) lipoprotein